MGKLPLLLRLVIAALIFTALPCAKSYSAGPTGQPSAFWLQGRIVASIPPLPNEGYIQIANRVMADPSGYRDIIAFNNNRPLMKGRNVRFPLIALKPEMRGNILRWMYPEDELTERGWAHTVGNPLETLIQLTLAYTGSKGRFKELARYNKIKNANKLRLGQEIAIPLAWIPDRLGFKPLSIKRPLKLVRDKKNGRIYAAYTLRKNETLYSVILRFTDRERAGEVRRMSELMVKLNRLKSVKAVPAGRPLKMPIEWISQEYLLSKGVKVKKGSLASIAPPKPSKPKRALPTGPLHVIIDPGHGGVDPGAVYGNRRSKNLIYEHEVVYDISLRLAGLLESKGIPTYLTVEDRKQRLPVSQISTRRMGKERVRVTPPYIMDHSKTSVNMRVYFIDSLFRRLTKKRGVPPENIFLISIHGDALAPTLRGAMVYFPDHRLRSGQFSPRGKAYRIRKEGVPVTIYFNRKASRQAHWMSESFAKEIISSLKSQGVGVGGRRPVRSYYYRDGERTLPAVLRYSRVPTSVLVEVANLNNIHDRKAIMIGSARQRIAKGIADAVLRKRRGKRSKKRPAPAVAYSRKAG